MDVVNPSGIHCNPAYQAIPTIANVNRSLRSFEHGIKRCETVFGIGELLHSALKRFRKKSTSAENSSAILVLHGCCLIFTPRFFREYQGFYDDTYLYGEEIILSYQCYIKNLLLKYIDTVKVLHNESRSTKAAFKKTVQRHKFYYENIYNSTMALKRLLEKEENVK